MSLALLASLLASCQLNRVSTNRAEATPTVAWTVAATPRRENTPTPSFTPSPIPIHTATPTATAEPTPTSSPTYAPLASFDTHLLRPNVIPQAYLAEPCEYLRLRWDAQSSPPGTVVVPVMFHSIVNNGREISDPKDISVEQFEEFVQYARFLGFETITTHQLLDFLQNNALIPEHSLLIIVDDRRPGLIQEHFMPVLEANNWTVTAAYIADPNSLDWAWDWMEQLNETGRLDVQSHGYTGQLYILPETPAEQIQNEIWNSTAVLEEHFGQRPVAFIWPGGNFTPLSVQIARQGDYKLGFTAYSRGPLMFNWIPLGELERQVNDPLMVLPRAWSNSVNVNMYEAIQVSEQAAQFAQENAATEQAWYATYCGGN